MALPHAAMGSGNDGRTFRSRQRDGKRASYPAFLPPSGGLDAWGITHQRRTSSIIVSMQGDTHPPEQSIITVIDLLSLACSPPLVANT